MTKTKRDFQNAALAAISEYPVAAQYAQARDPRLLASLDAMATMLALFAAEQDVSAMEPFTKARDVTVLADAAVKGVLPFGQAHRVSVAITNPSTAAINVTAGRRILDTQGRVYVVETGATIAPSGSGTVTAVQRTESPFTHVVAASQPFYRIEIPEPEPGKYVESITVASGSTPFTYNPDFVNVGVGDKVFNLETDENRRLYIQFGAADLVGYQPAAGETMNVTVNLTEGAINLPVGSPFALEYSYSLYENGATLTLDSVLSPGAAPMDIATLREVTSYPSVYDESAVYLGNFDFLVRRNLSPFRFLSVWNEQIEEEARGANIDNINRLFVAAMKDGVDQAVLESQIANIINAADDSYRLTFVPVDEVEIAMSVTAYVSAVNDFAAVAQQIREQIIAKYGRDSVWAKRGRSRILKKTVYDLLEDNVRALQDAVSDFDVTIVDPVEDIMPEHYRYVSNASLTITVEQVE